MADQNQYLGNPNLKKANTAVEFTKNDIKEYIDYKLENQKEDSSRFITLYKFKRSN